MHASDVGGQTIQRALRSALPRCTKLVIAHRLETIKTADRIVVVDAGRVVQSGTYEELASQEGLFRDSVMLETTKVDS